MAYAQYHTPHTYYIFCKKYAQNQLIFVANYAHFGGDGSETCSNYHA